MRRAADGRSLSTRMSELVLSAFAGEESAARVLRDLRVARPALDGLASAAIVSVGEAGSYDVGTTGHPGSGLGFPGMFWEALFGLVFLVPVPGSSYGPGAGALFETVVHVGVDDRFRARARRAWRRERPGWRSCSQTRAPSRCSRFSKRTGGPS